MRRRDVLIGAGAAALATQIPMAQAELGIPERPENKAYTVYKDHDGRGRDLHCYRGREILVSQEILPDIKKSTGYTFDDINRHSVDHLLDHEGDELIFHNPKGNTYRVVRKPPSVGTSHGEPYDVLHFTIFRDFDGNPTDLGV